MTSDDLHKRMSTRQKRLAFVAALTLAATAWAALQPAQRTDPAEPTEPAPIPSRRAENTAPGKASGPRRPDESAAAASVARPLAWPDSSHLGARSPWRAVLPQGVAAWSGPPPPPPPAPRATAPVAPPASVIAVAAATAPPVPAFPYKLIGRLDDGVPQALLSGASRSFGVKAGDSIDDQWRVESVEAQGVTVTWLRTGARKTLSFASS